jgi:hypothetical protein
MAREITIDCDSCGTRLPLERAKEALIAEGDNVFHLVDLCTECLDTLLQRAESVNDTDGFRQQAAALIRLPRGTELPRQKAG